MRCFSVDCWTNRKACGSKRGSVLVGVLWSLFSLAALALVINSLITTQLTVASRFRDRTLTKYYAQAGVQRAILEVRNDETEEYDTFNDTWFWNEDEFSDQDLGEGGGYFSIVYSSSEGEEEYFGLIDEERKISLNIAPADILSRVFETVEDISLDEAVEIADAIIDWRDEDDEPQKNGAEDSYYQALSDGYSCKNAPFEVLEELLLVKGVTQEIFDEVGGFLTVYGDGVNINTAGEIVLKSLGMDDGLAGKIISFRAGDDSEIATEDDNAFEDEKNIAVTLQSLVVLSNEEIAVLDDLVEQELIVVRSNFFWGRSLGGFRGAEYVSEIIFIVGRDERIRYWREG